MKQNDILLIVVAIIIGSTFSIILTKQFFGPSQRKVTVEIVEVITSDFQEPDKKYFNDSSFNPTQIITIGTDGGKIKFGN